MQSPGKDCFVVEGRWCVEALLDSGDYETLFILKTEGTHLDLDAKYQDHAEIYHLAKSKISEIAGYPFHRGVLAFAKRPTRKSIDTFHPQGLIIACPELADPANLGAIIRTGAALGAAGIIVPHGHGADVYARKSIRASSGAVFRLPIHESENLAADLGELKARNFMVMGTSLQTDSIPLREAPTYQDGVILFGREKDGLATKWQNLCDVTLKIPMKNGLDSLNVAASAAIVLYECLERNRAA